jgi:hypothetical protein
MNYSCSKEAWLAKFISSIFALKRRGWILVCLKINASFSLVKPGCINAA